MNKDYSFDELIDRKGSYSMKWDTLKEIFGSEDMLPFWVADMDFKAPPGVIEALSKRVEHGVFGYPAKGHSFFAAAAAWQHQRHNWQVETDWIVGSPGVVPAISMAILALTEPGDKIIIQPPVYPPFFQCVLKNGRQLVENPLMVVNGRYEIDFDDLKVKISSGAKMLLLCSPHNPVGRVWTREELTRLAQLCLEHNVIIISDEIHQDIVFSGSRHIPTCSLGPEIEQQTIGLVAPSKTFNIAGLSTSLTIIPREDWRKAFQSMQEAMGLRLGNLFGVIALEAAYKEGADWLNQLLNYLEGNLEEIVAILGKLTPHIAVSRPEACYLAWLDCRSLGLKQHELRQFFADQAKLGLNDGLAFGSQGRGYMRLNFGCPRQMLMKGLSRLEQGMKNLR